MDQQLPAKRATLFQRLKHSPKWVSFILLFLVVVVTPVTILLLDYFANPAQSWFDSAWEYRKPLTLTNGGGSKTDYDVLVVLDTASLIAENKIQANCNDIRIVDSDGITVLPYWIEGGCNTAETEIWTRVPSVPTGESTIHLYYGNGSALDAQQSWGGKISMYSLGSCPTGWTVNNDATGKFLRGSAAYGGTGGASSHTYGTVACTFSASGSGYGSTDGGTENLLNRFHSHGGDVTIGDSGDLLPNYENVVLCEAPSFAVKSGLVGVFESTPTGWTRSTNLDGDYIRVDTTAGGTGGNTTHSHTYSGVGSTSHDNQNFFSSRNISTVATGGTITTSGGYTIHRFTTSGTFELSSDKNIEYLVVGGGGGGASGVAYVGSGGGGGAGGMLTGSAVFTGGSYSVVVGAGGASNTSGGNSSVNSIIALGGGRGGRSGLAPASGGSGGGAGGDCERASTGSGAAGTADQGNSGGDVPALTCWAAGGGGKAAVGGSNGGAGGAGLASSITGSAVTYSKGGNPGGTYGGGWVCPGPGASGAANTGNGANGGDAKTSGPQACEGGVGGSGVVVLRYLTPSVEGIIASVNHTHVIGSGNTSTSSHLPSYIDAIFASSDSDTSLPTGSIVIANALPPLGWNRVSAFDGKVLKGSATYGTTGGSDTHDHTVTISGSSETLNGYYKASQNASPSTHTNTCTLESKSNLPPYLDVLYIKKVDNTVDGVTLNIGTEESNAPAMPTSVPAQALSTSSIRWNFIDNANNEVGFKIVDGDGLVKATCEGENLTYCDETGLSPNIQYTRYIIAYNTNGDSLQSDAVSRYTLTNTPSISITSVNSSTVNLSATGLTNLGVGLSALYFDCLSVDCVGSETIAQWLTVTSASAVNLQSNNQYSFRVKARNGDGVETSYSETVSNYTYANVPEFTVTNVTSSSVTPVVSNVPNLGEGQSAIFIVCECDTTSTVPNTWVGASEALIDGFTPNSSATITIKARNGDGVETAISDPITVHTLANVPLVPSISNLTDSAFNVSLNPSLGGNPSSVQYSIAYGENEYINNVDGTRGLVEVWADYDTWNFGGGVSVGGLTEGVEHSVKVRARNSDNVVTSFTDEVSAYTLLKTPTMVSGSALGSTSIRWNFTDNGANEEGFRLYDSGGNLLTTCVGANLTFCDETGLIPNTSYTRKVKAYNTNTESVFSGEVSQTTLATVPSLANITGTEGRASFGVLMNGNPGGTEILIKDQASNKFYNPVNGVLSDTEIWFEYVDTGEDLFVNNLSANTLYQFVIKARNSNEVESDFSSEYEVYTHAVSPSVVSVVGESATSVKVVIGNESNPSSTQFVIREVGSNKYVDNSSGALVDTPVWATYTQLGSSDGVVVTGLSANTEYTFETKGRNQDQIETDFSTTVAGHTLANTPAISSLVASSSTVIVVTIDNSSNPLTTQFALRETVSGLYVNSSTGVLQVSPSWATYAQWGGETGFGITSLSPNSQYSISVQARNSDNISTSFSSSQSLYTLANVPGSVNVSDAGVSTLRITLDTNGNPVATTYALYNVTNSKYIDYVSGNESDSAVWGTYAQWGGDSGYMISGLDSGTTYEFVSKARNANNVETSFSVGANISTSLNAPTIGIPQRLSETSIRWTFTDNESNEVGYRVYDDNDVQVAECVGTSLTSCVEYGMTPNTEYTRKVAAYNDNGRGGFSESVSRYTPASVPQISDSEAVTSSTLRLKIGSNGNPANTEYEIREVVSGLKVGNIVDGVATLVVGDSWQTLSNLGGDAGIVVSELFANAEYVFEVVARDGEGIVTAPSSQVVIYTLTVTTASPTLQALSESSMKAVIDTGGNSEVTTFAVKDVKGSRYFNYSNGLWQVEPVWGTYTQWGRTSGFTVTGLGVNTEYEIQVISKNGGGIESLPSPSSLIYTLANTPSRPTASLNSTSSVLVRVGANQNPVNTEYSLLDISSNRFVDPRTGNLVSSVRWGRLSDFGGANGITVGSLTPGARYEFIARARNGNQIESSSSSSFVTNTLANIPSVSDVNAVTLRSIRVRLNRNLNDPTVQFAVQEETLNRYVDFRTGLLVENPVWGTYSEFGGDLGVIVSGLTPVTDYSFRANARNAVGVVTGNGARRLFGTNAVIENVPVGVTISLKSNVTIDPSKDLGGQRGLQNIRVFRNNRVIADVPIEFSQNRDWGSAVITEDAGRVVVKLPSNSGLTGTYTMYVPKGDTNRFKLCTKAELLEQVNSDCAGNVIFAGPYPQTISVDDKPITVSVSVIDGVSYWVVSGLTGTGGLGEKVDTGGEVVKEPTVEEPDDEDEGETPAPPVVNTPNQTFNTVVNNVINTVTQSAPTQAVQAIDGVKIAIDNSVVGTLDQPQLSAVTTTATAATVTVGLAAVGGGFSTVPYMLTQFFLGVLSFLGFRKRGKPYGYVYNSVTKEPVSRAIIRIYDANSKLVWTDVTDVFGSFNAELPKGKYKILVKKGGFNYPTEIIKGMVDYPLEPIYKGEFLKMSRRDDVKVLIPVDPTKIDRFKALSISARTSINLMLKLLHVSIFIGGIILGVYTIVKFPGATNTFVFLFYIPAFFMLYKSIFGEESRYGYVKDMKGHPVANVEIALREMKFDRFVGKRVTDESGRYRFNIYPGAYELVVVSPNYKAMKFEGGSNVVDVSVKGDKIITKDITVQKK